MSHINYMFGRLNIMAYMINTRCKKLLIAWLPEGRKSYFHLGETLFFVSFMNVYLLSE